MQFNWDQNDTLTKRRVISLCNGKPCLAFLELGKFSM